jgi:predicted nucleotidyltransferase
MLTNQDMIKYLESMNTCLKEKGLSGEICMFGGAVMCLVFGSRTSTKDIDAIFAPTTEMYAIIKQIARDHNLPDDWLNPGVKGFLSSNHDVKLYRGLSHLKIYAASPEYLFAMKCLASRMVASKDLEDIQFLIRYLNIRTVKEALRILEKFYPPSRILPKTQYILEQLLPS